MITRGSYVHTPMLMQFSQNIDGFRQNNSPAFRTPKTLSTKPITALFYFHYLAKLYIGFKV